MSAPRGIFGVDPTDSIPFQLQCTTSGRELLFGDDETVLKIAEHFYSLTDNTNATDCMENQSAPDDIQPLKLGVEGSKTLSFDDVLDQIVSEFQQKKASLPSSISSLLSRRDESAKWVDDDEVDMMAEYFESIGQSLPPCVTTLMKQRDEFWSENEKDIYMVAARFYIQNNCLSNSIASRLVKRAEDNGEEIMTSLAKAVEYCRRGSKSSMDSSVVSAACLETALKQVRDNSDQVKSSVATDIMSNRSSIASDYSNSRGLEARCDRLEEKVKRDRREQEDVKLELLVDEYLSRDEPIPESLFDLLARRASAGSTRWHTADFPLARGHRARARGQSLLKVEWRKKADGRWGVGFRPHPEHPSRKFRPTASAAGSEDEVGLVGSLKVHKSSIDSIISRFENLVNDEASVHYMAYKLRCAGHPVPAGITRLIEGFRPKVPKVETALMKAAAKGDVDNCRRLLHNSKKRNGKKVNLQATDAKGRTAWHCLQEYNRDYLYGPAGSGFLDWKRLVEYQKFAELLYPGDALKEAYDLDDWKYSSYL